MGDGNRHSALCDSVLYRVTMYPGQVLHGRLAVADAPSTCCPSIGIQLGCSGICKQIASSPWNDMIDGRLFYKHSLLPVDIEVCNGDRSSERSKQAMLKETLASFAD